jgi:phosphorylcholine metabolism protein LicD
MKHSIDFFKDEIRNGFYIPTAIKQSWAAQLDVLSEIDRICSKHNIRYFADWGTFLGAVRHGGFVPWDDDLDICMLRDDYNKFREVADQELPQEYVIHDYERQQNHWLFLSRVVNSAHYGFTKEYLDSHYNYPWLAGVDIFVKDYQYREPVQEKERCDEVMFILAIAEGLISGTTKPDSPSVKANLKKLSDKYSYSFHSAGSERELAISLYHLAELQMLRVDPEDSDTVCQLFPWGLKGKAGEKKEYYDQSIRLPFEDTTIPVPARYNQCLRDRYGDYLVIRKGASAHDYPSFEAQKKLFETSTGARLPEFTFDASMLERPVPDKSASYKTLSKECFDGLCSHYHSAIAMLDSGKIEELAEICNEAQQLAVDLGTMLEQVRGESDIHCTAVVKILEELCEGIYSSYESASKGDKDSFLPIDTILKELEKSIDEHILNRKEILLLPASESSGEPLMPIYNKYSSDSSYDVVVMDLPLMLKDYYGNITGYGADSQCTYDISLHCPDAIYFQNPYDKENPCLTIPPEFYTENLRKYSDKLVFVPIGTISDFTDNTSVDSAVMKYYVSSPGVIMADEVWVQSETLKQRYVDRLALFAGEETRSIWEKKISSRPELFSINCSKESTADNASLQSSEDSVKNLLICIAAYEPYEHADDYESSLGARFDLLKENADKIHVSVCVYPDNNINKTVSKLCSEYGFRLVPYPSGSLKLFCQKYDAYYGSACPLVPVFAELKKPVMVADLGVN